MCFAPQGRALFRHLICQKCSDPGVFCTFWLGNVLRATTACRFSTTCKSAPTVMCFVHFDLEMCFAPQWRALFRHLNFQKWSEHGVFCTFWLGNAFRATRACNFSSLIWPHGSAPATLASPIFRPSGATNHQKNTVFRDFATFSRTWIFFLLRLSRLVSSFFFLLSSFFLLFFSSLLFSSLLWLFPSLLFICPYCQKFDF